MKPKAIGRLAKDDKLEVKIDFTTSESDGIIIWQGSTNPLQHWLALAGIIIEEQGLHFYEEYSQPFSSVKDGRLELHVYLGDSSSEAVLRSRARVDDGVRHRVVVSKHKVGAKKDGKSSISLAALTL